MGDAPFGRIRPGVDPAYDTGRHLSASHPAPQTGMAEGPDLPFIRPATESAATLPPPGDQGRVGLLPRNDVAPETGDGVGSRICRIHPRFHQIRAQRTDLAGRIRKLLSQDVHQRFEFDDPPDSGAVHSLVLTQPLHLAQEFDIPLGVTASASGGPARGYQPLAVVGAQGLGVHTGELRSHRDDEQRLNLRQ